MDFWDKGSVIVNVSYCVNIILVATLFFTIYQLYQNNRQYRQQLHHRAIDMALSQAQRFISSFMVDYIEFQKMKEDNKSPGLKVIIQNFNKADLINSGINESQINDYYQTHLVPVRKNLALLFNHLESISVYYQVGEADKKTGYKAMGNDFVDVFEMLYPDIQIASGYTIKKYLPHSVELYQQWKPLRDEFYNNLKLSESK